MLTNMDKLIKLSKLNKFTVSNEIFFKNLSGCLLIMLFSFDMLLRQRNCLSRLWSTRPITPGGTIFPNISSNRQFCLKIVQNNLCEGKTTKVTYHFKSSKIEVIKDASSRSSNSTIPSSPSSSTDKRYRDEFQFIHPFISQTLIRYLLPKGYPKSIDTGYLSFVKYQMLASIASTAGGVLSMQTLLYALGLGSVAGSLPIAATLNWILKDGIGQLGGIVFGGLINNRFDSNPKQWRMLSSIALDVSSLIEIMIAFVPTYFLPMASIANIGKNISFLAASASRAAIHKSFAKHENLADITAKTSSQTILSSTIGTAVGIGASLLVDNNIYNILGIYSMTASLSAYWMYRSMTYVTLKTLDLPRLDFVLYHWLSDNTKALANQKPNTSIIELLSPWDVRAFESTWLTSIHPTPLVRLSIGSPLTDVFRNEKEAVEIIEIFRNQKYIINYTLGSPAQGLTSKVHLLYKEDCTRDEMLQGLVHSYVVRSSLAASCDNTLDKVLLLSESMHRSRTLAAEQFRLKGWVLDEMLFEPIRSRLSVLPSC